MKWGHCTWKNLFKYLHGHWKSASWLCQIYINWPFFVFIIWSMPQPPLVSHTVLKMRQRQSNWEFKHRRMAFLHVPSNWVALFTWWTCTSSWLLWSGQYAVCYFLCKNINAYNIAHWVAGSVWNKGQPSTRDNFSKSQTKHCWSFSNYHTDLI